MAALKCCAISLTVVVIFAAEPHAAEPVEMRERMRPGATTHVKVELKAQGLYLAAAAAGAGKAESPKPLALKVEAELDFMERVLKADDEGHPSRVVRRVLRAGSAINGEIRPASSSLRPEVALLVGEPRGDKIVVFSPGGPLTRSELELVQGPGDPLALEGLLPAKPVSLGDRWVVSLGAAKSLTSYDVVGSNTLEATLETVDAGAAKVRLRGEVRGSVLGGEGTIACDGAYTFDRKAGRIDRLTLNRAETRRPGIVEEGLDVKSTLSVVRQAAEAPPELTDAVLGGLSLDSNPARERLVYRSPGGRYSLLHDRDWHTYWDDSRVTVLKRVVDERLTAQCNLAVGPNAGKGRHQETAQFRDDVRKGLGARFSQFLGAGEVEGDPAGGFRYKVGVQGRQGELGVVWYYYLIASPDGDQILATFTMAEPQLKAFGDEDELLIGSLRWRENEAKAVPAAPPR